MVEEFPTGMFTCSRQKGSSHTGFSNYGEANQGALILRNKHNNLFVRTFFSVITSPTVAAGSLLFSGLEDYTSLVLQCNRCQADMDYKHDEKT